MLIINSINAKAQENTVMNENLNCSLAKIWESFYENFTRDETKADYLNIRYIPEGSLYLKEHHFVIGDEKITPRYVMRRIEEAVRDTTGAVVSVKADMLSDDWGYVFETLDRLPDGGRFAYDIHVLVRNEKEQIRRIWTFVGHRRSSYKHSFKYDEVLLPELDGGEPPRETFFAEGCGITVSEPINLSNCGGRSASGAGIHSGHQTRVCRNRYATYTAYICEEVDGMNHLIVTKISREGQVGIIFDDYFPADSSSANIMRDDNDDIYVVAAPVNKLDPSFTETAWLVAYKIDPLTDKTETYKAIRRMPSPVIHGHGYSQPCFDHKNRKIHVIYTSGGAPGGMTLFTFDMETKTWLDTGIDYSLDYRFCYHIPFALDDGGIIMTSERDITKQDAGHPEIMYAEYSWDELRLFTIPDPTKPEISNVMVEPADFSRTSEGLYPGILNNQEGGSYMDDKGRVHVIYTIKYYSLVSGKGYERILKHKVFDGEKEIHCAKLPFQGRYSFRMYQTTSGRHYIIAISYNGPVVCEIWRATDEDGFNYEKVAQYAVPSGEPLAHTLCLASARNNSVRDNVCDMIYSIQAKNYQCDYIYLSIKFDE